VDIGIPRETRPRERRVGLTPSAVKALVQSEHRVFVETGAGAGAGHTDAEYESAGAKIVFSPAEVYGRGELITGVFAPSARHFELLTPRRVVFGFWGLPAMRPEDFRVLQSRGVTAVGNEIIEDAHGHAPVLTAMSEIAGRLAVTVGAGLLLNEFGGSGILLGGAPGVPPAHLVILGAGVLGRAAARAAVGAGAQVTLLDRSIDSLRAALADIPGPAASLLSTRPNIEKALSYANLVLGAVAVHGDRAPVLVTRPMLGLMRPRSVVMDLSIDMGGCFETSRPTSFPDPVYEVDGILHFCVPNLPSAAARSSTLALTNTVLPYVAEVAGRGFDRAATTLPDLRRGTYLYGGECCREPLARLFGVPYVPMPVPEAR
jgi:alanine dehydrogenase